MQIYKWNNSKLEIAVTSYVMLFIFYYLYPNLYILVLNSMIINNKIKI